VSAPPEFAEAFAHLREFHRTGSGHRRARRGDVRAAILDLLAEGQARNGYQIIQEIGERTSGVWRPSAGSVYPALEQLEDEGLISPEGEGRRRLYTLTDEGRAYAQAHAEELRASWGAVAGRIDDTVLELGDLFRQVALAAMEVRRAGTASQLAAARRVLAEARRELYLILANDVAADDIDGDTAATSTAPGTPDAGIEDDFEADDTEAELGDE
jgi:DNA-binding PadR family transcriptional regulator